MPDATARYDAIVLGAGISGLVSASILLDQGARRILVADEYARAGGNHIDVSKGPFTFDVGSLIFQDDSPLLRHFPELLPLYLPADPTWGRLNPQGMVTAYPLSLRDDLLAAGWLELARMAVSVAHGRLRRRPQRTARDFAEYWLGARFLDRSGLGSYIERFCGVPPEDVDIRFAEQRMEWIPRYGRIAALVGHALRAVQSRQAQPTNHQLVRPPEGFTHLYEPAVRGLEQRGATFLLGHPFRGLERLDQGYVLAVGSERHAAPRVVSTIPIDRALDVCGLRRAGRLPTVTLISLFFSFRGQRGFAPSVFYNFSHEAAWKRLTVHSDFYGPAEGREYLTVEVVGGSVGNSVAAAEHDFRQHVSSHGLLRGDLRLEGSHLLENAYPIYTRGSNERAEAGVEALRRFGVESLGRQGRFRYQPTARASTVEAEQALSAGQDGSSDRAVPIHLQARPMADGSADAR